MGGIVPWMGGNAYVSPFAAPYPVAAPPPPPAPPSLKDWWKELHRQTTREPPNRVHSAVVGLRHNGESAAMGAMLAFIDTDLGGLDLGGRVPLDWVGAALFYALSVRDAGNPDGLSSDFQAMSQSCTTVAMYRMIQQWREGRKTISRNAGVSGDPVLKAKISF